MNWSTQTVYVIKEYLPMTISYLSSVKPFYYDASYCGSSTMTVSIDATPTINSNEISINAIRDNAIELGSSMVTDNVYQFRIAATLDIKGVGATKY